MRLRRLRGFWVMSLLLFGFIAVSCSSQQQGQEDLETSMDEEQGEVNSQEGQDDYYQGQSNELGYDTNQALPEGDLQGLESGEQLLNAEGKSADAYGDAGGDNELANIIDEMNQINGDGADGEMVNDSGVFDQGNAYDAGNQSYEQGLSSAPMVDGGGVVTGVAGLPAGPGLPELGSKMSYIVVKGDTLGKISNRIYGTVGKWRELAENSGFEDPSKIYPGDVVYYQLTSEAVAFASDYENLETQEITVREGETLRGIASRTYGDAGTWKYIWRQNGQIMNPDKIDAGTKLYVMPKKTLVALKKDKFGTHSIDQLAANKTEAEESMQESAIVASQKATAVGVQVVTPEVIKAELWSDDNSFLANVAKWDV